MCADSACPCTHAGTMHRYRVAAGGRNSSEGWVTIANATDVPGKPWAPRFASSSSVCVCVRCGGARVRYLSASDDSGLDADQCQCQCQCQCQRVNVSASVGVNPAHAPRRCDCSWPRGTWRPGPSASTRRRVCESPTPFRDPAKTTAAVADRVWDGRQ